MSQYYVGTDIVAVNRFSEYNARADSYLLRMFLPYELAYCKRKPSALSAQSFATHFAAKEAVYKALCNVCVVLPSFRAFLLWCQICHTAYGVPYVVLDKKAIAPYLLASYKSIEVSISLAHTDEYAIAYALIHVVRSIE